MAIPILKMLTVGVLPSPLKKIYYRARGAEIGRGVSLGIFSVIDAYSIKIGDGTTIGALSFIKCRKLTLGKRVKIHMMVAIDTGVVSIDDDSSIMEQVVVGGMLTPRSELSIGKRVKIFPYSFLNPTEKITIEDEVGIGGANYLFTHGSWQPEIDGFPIAFGPILVKKGVWFPWRVFVMPNVTVGEYATIGAGSILTKDIPPRCLAAGSPAKVIRDEGQHIRLVDDEEKHALLQQYLLEMAAFLKYEGYKVKDEKPSSEGYRFSCNFKNKEAIIAYSKEMRSPASILPEVIILLKTIPEKLKKEIVADGKTYFDVETRETYCNRSMEWYAVRDFLSRYGLRFNVLN